MASLAPASDGSETVTSLDSDCVCWMQFAVVLQPQGWDGEERMEPVLRPSPMFRTDLASPRSLVTLLALAVMQWRSLERLAHAAVCVHFLCNMYSEQSFPDTADNISNID